MMTMGKNMAAWLPLALALAWGWCPTARCAADTQQVDPDKALQSIGKPRWYDRESDSYKPPRIADDNDNVIRREGWIAEAANQKEKNKAQKTGSTSGFWNWLTTSFVANWFSTVVISTLAILLVVVILLLTYHSLRHYMPNKWEQTQKTVAIEIDPAKVADLPFEVKRAAYQNPLAEAEALMRAGRFSQAIVFLYGYMLLALDQSRKIELQKGKTNRMYLRELRAHARLRTIVEGAMFAFEDVYFGKHEIAREQFLEHWSQMDEFHQLAAQATAPQVTSRPEIVTA